MRLSSLVTLWLVALAGIASSNTAPFVSDVEASQDQTTGVVHICYDVVDLDGDIMTVTAVASNDGGSSFTIPVETATGDMGPGIVSGNSKHIIWDVWMDYPGQLGPDYVIRVTACDPAASTIRVDLNGGGDYLTIREGIEAASPGDVVTVAPGTYTGPDNRDLDFAGKNIVVRSEEGRQNTVIDCQYQGRAFYLHDGEDQTAVVQGFTIIHGTVETSGSGPGIFCYNASPTIIDCTFQNNAVYIGSGCGIGCVSSSPTITNCGFFDNNLSGDFCAGGGISVADGSATITNCDFAGNIATFGGGIVFENATATVTGCDFTDNSHPGGDGGGGAIHAQNECTLVIRDCTFIDNSTGSYGGAISLNGTHVTIENCTFQGNYTTEFDNWGGGIDFQSSSGTITNCTFTDNSAKYGAGIVVGWASSVSITNTIIAFNAVGEGIRCGDGDGYLTHCCVYGNAGGNVLWCDATDVIEVNPLFCDRPSGDLTLCSNSPCLPGGGNPTLIGAYGQGCGPCSKR